MLITIRADRAAVCNCSQSLQLKCRKSCFWRMLQINKEVDCTCQPCNTPAILPCNELSTIPVQTENEPNDGQDDIPHPHTVSNWNSLHFYTVLF